MSEPIKKPNQIDPESYSPKTPKFLNMMQERTQSEVDNIIKNHVVEMLGIEYIHLPASRFIGKEIEGKIKITEKADMLWGKANEIFAVLDAMEDCAFMITEPCGFMHQDDMESGKKGTKYHYIVGKFMKAATPVPDGFSYRDIPESDVALATFYGEFNDMIKKMYVATRDKILGDGKGIPYPVGYFHAEVYIKECNPNPGAVSNLSYLFSCKKEK